MTDIKTRFLHLITLLLLLTACISEPPDKPEKWTSKYHDIEVEYSAPWGLVVPNIDTEDKTLIGFMDKSNGTSYIVKITNDVPKSQLTDEQYYQVTTNAMLEANEKNRLLEESNVDFHGQTFHRQVFLLYTEKWGLLKHYAQILRTGEKMVAVQMSFPVEEQNAESATLSQQLIKLDKKVKINGK